VLCIPKLSASFFPALAALALLCAGCGGGSESEEEGIPAAQASGEIATIKRMLDDALGDYRAGRASAAERTVGDAYLEHFEELEEALEERDHDLMEELEERLSTGIRDDMKAREPADEIAAAIAETKRELDRAARALEE
jgi:hypothetical protein